MYWTDEEIDYLESRWGSVSIRVIAGHLGRSINAVKLKANRIGLQDARFSSNVITVNQLSLALGQDYKTMRRWINLYDFPARQKIFTKTKTLVVSYDDFWKWVEKNKHRVNLSRMEPLTLGPEPEWAKEKRKADFLCRNRNFEKWTKEEDAQLKGLVLQYRYTYPEIALLLNRTEGAIKRRLEEFGIKARPVRLDNHIMWTTEEEHELISLYEKGYSFEAISGRLGKSARGCRGKLERMGYQFSQSK